MSPEFAALVNPTIHQVLETVDRLKSGQQVNLETEKGTLRNFLDQAKRQARALGVNQDEYQLARLGLVYWIDELMTLADPRWQTMTLEWDECQTQERAWKFYVDGERLAKRSTANIVELWYLCVVLGFEGDIMNAYTQHLRFDVPAQTNGEELRKRWAAGLKAMIPGDQPADLAEAPLRGDLRFLTGERRLFAASATAAGLLLVTLLLVVFWMKLKH